MISSISSMYRTQCTKKLSVYRFSSFNFLLIFRSMNRMNTAQMMTPIENRMLTTMARVKRDASESGHG